MEFGKAIPYDIRISSSHNMGFIVKVGCCTAVFTSKASLIGALDEYLSEPASLEKLYNSKCSRPVEQAEEERPQEESRNLV